jgi:hypothetical protein
MPTPPERGQPEDRPALEPIVVLRPRRTDALAALFRDEPQDIGRYESVVMPRRLSRTTEDETQELPTVSARRTARDTGRSFGFGPGQRRAAVVIGVAAAALIGFGCALLLPGRDNATAAPPPSPSPTPTASTAPPSAAADPDGPGTLREGASGPEVTDLQERLLRIPDVYADGSTNGAYDTVLTEAVARFQLWYGIRGDETGVYGDDTRLALESRTG